MHYNYSNKWNYLLNTSLPATTGTLAHSTTTAGTRRRCAWAIPPILCTRPHGCSALPPACATTRPTKGRDSTLFYPKSALAHMLAISVSAPNHLPPLSTQYSTPSRIAFPSSSAVILPSTDILPLFHLFTSRFCHSSAGWCVALLRRSRKNGCARQTFFGGKKLTVRFGRP